MSHSHLRTFPSLHFRPQHLFTLGSPISATMVFRGQRWKNYHPVGIPFHNIFHFYDPVAYRIEPLIDSRYTSISPVVLTPCGGGSPMQYQSYKSLLFNYLPNLSELVLPERLLPQFPEFSLPDLISLPNWRPRRPMTMNLPLLPQVQIPNVGFLSKNGWASGWWNRMDEKHHDLSITHTHESNNNLNDHDNNRNCSDLDEERNEEDADHNISNDITENDIIETERNILQHSKSIPSRLNLSTRKSPRLKKVNEHLKDSNVIKLECDDDHDRKGNQFKLKRKNSISPTPVLKKRTRLQIPSIPISSSHEIMTNDDELEDKNQNKWRTGRKRKNEIPHNINTLTRSNSISSSPSTSVQSGSTSVSASAGASTVVDVLTEHVVRMAGSVTEVLSGVVDIVKGNSSFLNSSNTNDKKEISDIKETEGSEKHQDDDNDHDEVRQVELTLLAAAKEANDSVTHLTSVNGTHNHDSPSNIIKNEFTKGEIKSFHIDLPPSLTTPPKSNDDASSTTPTRKMDSKFQFHSPSGSGPNDDTLATPTPTLEPIPPLDIKDALIERLDFVTRTSGLEQEYSFFSHSSSSTSSSIPPPTLISSTNKTENNNPSNLNSIPQPSSSSSSSSTSNSSSTFTTTGSTSTSTFGNPFGTTSWGGGWGIGGYLAMIKAHFGYWGDRDVMYHILKNTLDIPDHDSQK